MSNQYVTRTQNASFRPEQNYNMGYNQPRGSVQRQQGYSQPRQDPYGQRQQQTINPQAYTVRPPQQLPAMSRQAPQQQIRQQPNQMRQSQVGQQLLPPLRQPQQQQQQRGYPAMAAASPQQQYPVHYASQAAPADLYQRGIQKQLPAIRQQNKQHQRLQQDDEPQEYPQEISHVPAYFPKDKFYHKPVHTDHSEQEIQMAHPYFPEHITMVRIRTPSRWGPSRIATPFEVRTTMTTGERYSLNPTKTKTLDHFEFEPYTSTDYRSLMSRYQNMHLPRGLGHTETERWHVEVS